MSLISIAIRPSLRRQHDRGIEPAGAGPYVVTVLRSYGARLAVPLILATIVILVGLEVARSPRADAVDGCRPTPDGIVCGYGSRSVQAVY